ncbi:MAG: Hsp20/alpha crystallin family protein [Proteobacteria bacterium]|nr:Hsp20/alpha crystallin family protein [Pseudomonadota bacterium]
MQTTPTITESIVPRVEDFFSFISQANGAVRLARVNVQETPKEYIITADLPGFSKKEVEVSLSEKMLTISAERTERKEKKSEEYLVHERKYHTLQRSIPVRDASTEEVHAELKDGVLEIHVKKSVEKQSKKVKVL